MTKAEATVLYNLISAVTAHLFCYKRISKSSKGGDYKTHEYQKAAILEAALHNQFAPEQEGGT